MAAWLSIVIPARNDAEALGRTLDHLSGLPGIADAEIIVAAAGDRHGTERAVAGRACVIWPGGSTRAALMNAGAAAARGEALFFLHADSLPPVNALELIDGALADPRAVGGAFEHLFAESSVSLRLITYINRIRYRLTRNYYGDQGVFVRASVFRQLGGYRDLRLLEDLDFTQRLKRRGRSVLIRVPLLTSGRRFLARGPWRTFFFIVWLLALHTLRLSTQRYAERWRGPADRTPGMPWPTAPRPSQATLESTQARLGRRTPFGFAPPPRPHGPHDKKTAPVLVTGATGFIGREIVRQLLAAGRPVLALARSRDGASALERVIDAVGAGLQTTSLHVVKGDLAAPGCGLGSDEWRRLRATAETVIHCAGDTTFFPEALAPYIAGHIDGPLRLLHGLAGGRVRRWAHLSTAYVCGRRSGTVLEREGDVGQQFHNTYERVKLESETAMRDAALRLGLDVAVFRPSIVVGAAPATSGGNPANLFFSFIRMVAALAELPHGAETRLRIEAAPRAPFNIVPVGYVAAAVIALAEHPEAAGETFHLVVPDAPTQADMLALITARLGVHGLSLVDPLIEPLMAPSAFERAVARMLEGYRSYLTQHVRFDDSTTRRLLAGCAVPRATLSPDAVHRLIDLALITDDARSMAAVHGEVSP